MSQINDLQDGIIKQFEGLENWFDKYEKIIEIEKVSSIQALYVDDSMLVKGCQASVWIDELSEKGRLYFLSKSDSAIVSGLASILCNVFSGSTQKEIDEANLYVFDRLGLNEHLSPTRSNGLNSIIKHIKK